MFPWLRLKSGRGTETPTPQEWALLSARWRIVLERIGLIEDVEIGVAIRDGQADVGLGPLRRPACRRPGRAGWPSQGGARARRGSGRGGVGKRAADLQPLGLARHPEQGTESPEVVAVLLLGLGQADLGRLALDLQPMVVGARAAGSGGAFEAFRAPSPARDALRASLTVSRAARTSTNRV